MLRRWGETSDFRERVGRIRKRRRRGKGRERPRRMGAGKEEDHEMTMGARVPGDIDQELGREGGEDDGCFDDDDGRDDDGDDKEEEEWVRVEREVSACLGRIHIVRPRDLASGAVAALESLRHGLDKAGEIASAMPMTAASSSVAPALLLIDSLNAFESIERGGGGDRPVVVIVG